jgi:hypothetical protein
MKQFLSRCAMFIVLPVCIMACAKNKTLPNDNLKALYGSWEWKESYCGWSGRSDPGTTGHSSSVEFKKNGICIWRLDGKHKDKMHYSVEEGTSMVTQEKAYLMKFDDTGLFDKNNAGITQSVNFHGNDTLILADEADDGCGSTYVRKK